MFWFEVKKTQSYHRKLPAIVLLSIWLVVYIASTLKTHAIDSAYIIADTRSRIAPNNHISKLYTASKPYLWFGKISTYLVLLQNTSEIRPNGWFFWSYALVTLQSWHVKTIRVEDSYVIPYLNSGAVIQAPQWSESLYWKIWFIAWNKFWFTDIDWRSMSLIFASVFPRTRIDWVIFMTTDALTRFDPSSTLKIFERQFINAASDLLAQQKNPYKKQRYMDDVLSYIKKIKPSLIHFEPWDINIYLPDAPKIINNTLIDYNLKTIPRDDMAYVWTSNHAWNKIDAFVQRNISIVWDAGIFEGKDRAILTWKKAALYIDSSLNIPVRYNQLISWLEKKYSITLGAREHYILSSKDPTYNHQTMVVIPQWRKIVSHTWNLQNPRTLDSPYWTIFVYQQRWWTGQYSAIIDLQR